MSAFYSLHVQIPIDEDCLQLPEIKEALEYLNDCHNDGDACDYEHGVLDIGLANTVANATVSNIDNYLRTIGKHARESAMVYYEYEGDHSFFGIGPDEEAALDAEDIEYLKRIIDDAELVRNPDDSVRDKLEQIIHLANEIKEDLESRG